MWNITCFQQATLMVTAAAALLGVATHPVPWQFCLASIACNLGSAIATTTLLCYFESDHALHVAWYEGGALFILALSGPGAWLHWGTVTLLVALLSFIWVNQPLTTKVIRTMLVAIQFVLFFLLSLLGGQTPSFWGAVQLFTTPDHLTLESAEAPRRTGLA